MIERRDLLAFNFYKKEKFDGSYLGMRYRIQKIKEEDEKELFAVFTWDGPYSFAVTADEGKVEKHFAFEEDSLDEITEYLNRVYEENKDNWHIGICGI